MNKADETEHDRIREAYMKMATMAHYRPQAPSDGFGNVQLTAEEQFDSKRLAREAAAYADRFIAEENETTFDIGCSDFSTNRALVYTIEAARLLCDGISGQHFALKLLEMAADDVRSAIAER